MDSTILDQLISVLFNGAFEGALLALIALSLTLIWGVLNVFNLSHGAFFMFGAYLAYILMVLWGLPFFMALPITFLLSFLLGFGLEKVLIKPLRPKAEFFGFGAMIVTFGLSMFMENSVRGIFGGTTKGIPPFLTGTVYLAGSVFSIERIAIFLMAIGLILALALFVGKMKVGISIRAVAEDAGAASLMGINVNRVYSLTFGLGIALATAAGFLIVPIISATPSMGTDFLLLSCIIVVLGGMGNLRGNLFAGFFIGIVKSLAAMFIGGGKEFLILFIIMIVALLIKYRRTR